MMTYISVVHGAIMIPRIGQMMELNARFQRAGQNYHKTSAAIRGQSRTRTVRKQHIATLLYSVYVHEIRDPMVEKWISRQPGGCQYEIQPVIILTSGSSCISTNFEYPGHLPDQRA